MKTRKRFTKAELISFAKFILSNERTDSITQHPGLKHCLQERLLSVSDADYQNWLTNNK